jgi:hypothetical protein
MEGRPRIMDGDCNGTLVVDMGAHEYDRATVGDFSRDCTWNLDDLLILVDVWLEGDSPLDVIPMGGDGIVNLGELSLLGMYWEE